MKGLINGGVFGFPGVSQLMTFPDRTDVTVRNRTVQCNPIALLPVHALKAALLEVTHRPVPHLGIGQRIYRHLLSSLSISTEVQIEGTEMVVHSAKWCGNIARLQSGFVDIEIETMLFLDYVFTGNRLRPIPDTINIAIRGRCCSPYSSVMGPCNTPSAAPFYKYRARRTAGGVVLQTMFELGNGEIGESTS